MSTYNLNTRMAQKTDIAANWSANSTVVLLNGEIGFESDTGKFKVGNGTSAWSELAYYEVFSTDLKNKVDGIAEGAEVNQNAIANITDGTNTIAADAKQDSVTFAGENGIVVTVDAATSTITIDGTHNHDDEYLSLAGGTLTGALTLAGAPTDANQAANKAYVDSIITSNDAMVFKGIVDAENTLPAADYETGWTWKVAAAGTYAGNVCEVGDLIVTVNAWAEGSASDADFAVFQANIDGAVTSSETEAVTTATVPVYDGTSGRIIKSSGFTIAKSVPADAEFTDTVYTHPDTAGNKHIPAGGAEGQILTYESDGTATWADPAVYTIATADVAGIVKSSADQNKVSVAADGVMEVNTINVSKLAQTAGDTLVLSGGSASSVL